MYKLNYHKYMFEAQPLVPITNKLMLTLPEVQAFTRLSKEMLTQVIAQ